MTVTIDQVQASQPERLTEAAGEVGRSALANDVHIATQHKVVAALKTGWEADASTRRWPTRKAPWPASPVATALAAN